MTTAYNHAAKQATAAALDGWILNNGTPPGQRSGTMLCLTDKDARPYAIGCGTTDLEAANALLTDMTTRARRWLALRRTVRTWRESLREEAAAHRAEKSATFLATH